MRHSPFAQGATQKLPEPFIVHFLWPPLDFLLSTHILFFTYTPNLYLFVLAISCADTSSNKRKRPKTRAKTCGCHALNSSCAQPFYLLRLHSEPAAYDIPR